LDVDNITQHDLYGTCNFMVPKHSICQSSVRRKTVIAVYANGSQLRQLFVSPSVCRRVTEQWFPMVTLSASYICYCIHLSAHFT